METEARPGATAVEPGSGPEALYASLHRAIEHGVDDEKIWMSLVQTCVQLDRREEALDAYSHIESFGPRTRIHRMLVDHGWLRENDAKPTLEGMCVTDHDLEPSLGDSVADTLWFLVDKRVATITIALTAGFGVTLGVGGLLHKGLGVIVVSILVIPLAVALFGVTGAMARRVFLSARKGLADTPDFPDKQELLSEAKPAALNLLVAGALVLWPGIVLHLLLHGAIFGVPVLLIGFALLPLVFALRQLSASWRECGPRQWFRVLKLTRPQLLPATAFNLLLFAPAAVTMYLTLDRPVYLWLCFTGLLSATALLASARLLGQVFHYRRDAIAGALSPSRQETA